MARSVPPEAASAPQSSRSHPLGPLFPRVVVTRRVHRVAFGGLTLLLAGTVLGVALWLDPDPRGVGTHEQLGALQPCGMLQLFGVPCPSCGMTTAFAHSVRGQWWQAFQAQPLGFLLAVATLVAAVLALWVLIRGRTWTLNLYRVRPGVLIGGVLLAFAASWGYKVLVHLNF